MKQFSLVLNIVLLAAVAVLFYLHFSDKKNKAGYKPITDSINPTSFKTVYFSIDSIENNYEFYRQVNSYIRSKQEQVSNEMNKLRANLSNKAKEYEQRGPSMSQTEQTSFQQEFARMQSEYQSIGEQKTQELQGESLRKLQEVKAKIEDFLKDYSRQRGYVFVYATGSENDNLYYKDTSRDITSELVRLLNERYRAEQKQKK